MKNFTLISIITMLFCIHSFTQHEVIERDSVQKLVRLLKEKNCIHNFYVGPSARSSETYYLADLIISNSSDEELFNYSLDSNRILSTYAIIGLISKRRMYYIFEIWQAKENDERLIETLTGCIGSKHKFNLFMAAQIWKRKDLWKIFPKKLQKSILNKFSQRQLKKVKWYGF